MHRTLLLHHPVSMAHVLCVLISLDLTAQFSAIYVPLKDTKMVLFSSLSPRVTVVCVRERARKKANMPMTSKGSNEIKASL